MLSGTLEYDHGYAAGYEVTYLPGDDRKEVRPPAGDYPSAFYGDGAALYEKYMADGAPTSWREWLAALPDKQKPTGRHQQRSAGMPSGSVPQAQPDPQAPPGSELG